jgi:hypothetical protein
MTGRAHLTARSEAVLAKWLRPLGRGIRLKYWF